MRRSTKLAKRSLLLAGLLAATTAAGACGTNGYNGILVPLDQPIGGTIAELSVTPDTVNVIAVGDAVQLSADATDAKGAPVPDAVIAWSSSDLSVATVSAGGIVTGVGEGRAVVTASSGGVSAIADVTVGLVRGLTGTP